MNWEVLVDWDNNDDYEGTYDDISNRVNILKGVTATRGRDPSRSLGEPRIPALQFDALNDDKFFSNEFAGSPIYQKATTGRPVRFQMAPRGTPPNIDASSVPIDDPNTYVDGTTQAIIFTGFSDKLTHHPDYQDRSVTIRSLGSLIRLRGRPKISTALYTNVTTGVAMGYLLDAVGWPADMRDISETAVVLKQWWLDREDAYTAAVDLLHSEGPGAALYEDEYGRIVFEGQTYRVNQSRSLNVQAQFMHDGTGIYFADPEHVDGGEHIINVATYAVKIRELGGIQQIWAHGSTSIGFSANETKTFEVFADDPLTGVVVTLLAGTDYVIASGTITAATATQLDAVRLLVSVTAGAGGATLSSLQVRGTPYYVVTDTEATNTVDTSASQDSHGIQSRDISGRPEIDINQAAAICDTTVQRYAEPRAVNRFAIMGVTEQMLNQAVSRRISDRIHYKEAQTGQDIDAFIESLEYRIVGSHLTCIVGCERTQSPSGVGAYGRWDQAVFDEGIFGQ